MDEIKISSELRLPSDFEIGIYNMVGRKVETHRNMDQSNMMINVKDLQSGLYSLFITDGAKNTRKQFVKQ